MSLVHFLNFRNKTLIKLKLKVFKQNDKKLKKFDLLKMIPLNHFNNIKPDVRFQFFIRTSG
jgi:hypothetical protein